MVINNVVSSTRLQDGSEYFLLPDRMAKEKKHSLPSFPSKPVFGNSSLLRVTIKSY
jgi:hypothetical protein